MTPTCLILAKDKHCGSVCCGLKPCRWAGGKAHRKPLSVRERGHPKNNQDRQTPSGGQNTCAFEPSSHLHTRPWPDQVLRTILQRDSSGSAVWSALWEDQQNALKSRVWFYFALVNQEQPSYGNCCFHKSSRFHCFFVLERLGRRGRPVVVLSTVKRHCRQTHLSVLAVIGRSPLQSLPYYLSFFCQIWGYKLSCINAYAFADC